MDVLEAAVVHKESSPQDSNTPMEAHEGNHEGELVETVVESAVEVTPVTPTRIFEERTSNKQKRKARQASFREKLLAALRAVGSPSTCKQICDQLKGMYGDDLPSRYNLSVSASFSTSPHFVSKGKTSSGDKLWWIAEPGEMTVKRAKKRKVNPPEDQPVVAVEGSQPTDPSQSQADLSQSQNELGQSQGELSQGENGQSLEASLPLVPVAPAIPAKTPEKPKRKRNSAPFERNNYNRYKGKATLRSKIIDALTILGGEGTYAQIDSQIEKMFGPHKRSKLSTVVCGFCVKKSKNENGKFVWALPDESHVVEKVAEQLEAVAEKAAEQAAEQSHGEVQSEVAQEGHTVPGDCFGCHRKELSMIAVPCGHCFCGNLFCKMTNATHCIVCGKLVESRVAIKLTMRPPSPHQNNVVSESHVESQVEPQSEEAIPMIDTSSLPLVPPQQEATTAEVIQAIQETPVEQP
eukprot:TRINITY_DN5227_c0_g1_i1.p1 TRINITY_DN5227_c0_g1~~TRINITY_DN5227_c0_g1_i1.p1  ORF type:complete len:464 (+),score=126.61 TRINITY_DN5227_c0_g1_i1:176-1567(+)